MPNTVISTLASTGGDPTLLLIAASVLVGALLTVLCLALDVVGFRVRVRRRHRAAHPVDTPQQAWATATTPEPAAALR